MTKRDRGPGPALRWAAALAVVVSLLGGDVGRAEAADPPNGLSGVFGEDSSSAQVVPGTGAMTYAVPFQLPASRGTAQPSLGLHYASGAGTEEAIDNFSNLAKSGLDPTRAPTWVTTDLAAAQNAIGPGRVLSTGQGIDTGVIRSVVPQAQFDALQATGGISGYRTWTGFGGGAEVRGVCASPPRRYQPLQRWDRAMSERFNILALISSRSAQRSYHVAAEQHVRIEFRNMASGETVEPFTYTGDLVVTCYRGVFSIAVGGQQPFSVGEFDQVVVPAGARVQLECRGEGTVQIIWAPAQAPTVKG